MRSLEAGHELRSPRRRVRHRVRQNIDTPVDGRLQAGQVLRVCEYGEVKPVRFGRRGLNHGERHIRYPCALERSCKKLDSIRASTSESGDLRHRRLRCRYHW